MNKKIVLSLGVALALFSGCGGSSSGDDGGDVVTTGTGYYIDSAVAGVDYTCGSESNVTDKDGKFTFEKGKDCTFSVAGVELRKVEAEKLSDKVKIVEDKPEVAVFLQSIDIDGNVSNGIEIKPEVLAVLKEALKNHTTVPTDDNLTNVVNEVKNSVTEFKGKVVTREKAMEHVKDSQESVLKELLGGKTFYSITEGDNEVNTVTINENVTKFKDYDISIDGNKVTFGDGFYMIFRKQTADYLIMDNYSATGNKENSRRLYFDKTKAEAYMNSLENGDDVAPANDLKALLAGKTFWEVDNRTDGKELNKLVFNTAFTSIVIEEATGNNIGKKETVNITYTNGKINFSDGGYTEFKSKTADYIDLADSDGETTRLYFSKAEAEKYLQSGNNLAITQEMLNGKTFYDSFTETDVSDPKTCYGKNTFAQSSAKRDQICYDESGVKLDEMHITINYDIIDSKIRADTGDQYKWFTLSSKSDSQWKMINDDDDNKDGTIDSAGEINIWYLSKPANFPAEL